MDISGLQNLYDMAHQEEINGRYLDAAKMYGQLTSMISTSGNPDSADIYCKSATGMARCANKDQQYDKAIELLEKQMKTDSESPDYMRNTLSYSYLCKAAKCCSSYYKGGVGMPCSRQETENMESWLNAVESLNPTSDEITGLYSQSLWAVEQARKRRFRIDNTIIFTLAVIAGIIGLFFFLISSSPELKSNVIGFAGNRASQFKEIIDRILLTTGNITVLGNIPYFLYITLWYGGGVLLYLAGSFPKRYNIGPRRKIGLIRGLLLFLFMPVTGLFRFLKSLKK